MNIIAVTGIFSGVGLIMFLLPPVPGTPVPFWVARVGRARQ